MGSAWYAEDFTYNHPWREGGGMNLITKLDDERLQYYGHPRFVMVKDDWNCVIDSLRASLQREEELRKEIADHAKRVSYRCPVCGAHHLSPAPEKVDVARSLYADDYVFSLVAERDAALLAKEKAERQLCRAREAIYAERERISLPIYDRLIISTLPPTIPCRHAEELEKLKKEVGR
jgi:hypothetical protein